MLEEVLFWRAKDGINEMGTVLVPHRAKLCSTCVNIGKVSFLKFNI